MTKNRRECATHSQRDKSLRGPAPADRPFVPLAGSVVGQRFSSAREAPQEERHRGGKTRGVADDRESAAPEQQRDCARARASIVTPNGRTPWRRAPWSAPRLAVGEHE